MTDDPVLVPPFLTAYLTESGNVECHISIPLTQVGSLGNFVTGLRIVSPDTSPTGSQIKSLMRLVDQAAARVTQLMPESLMKEISETVFEELGMGDSNADPMLLACRAVRETAIKLMKEVLRDAIERGSDQEDRQDG